MNNQLHGHYSVIARTPRRSGVYCLYRKGRVIYVGQTSSFLHRVLNHFHAKKFQFEQIAFLPVSDRQRRIAMEAELIERHKPAMNKLKQFPQPRDMVSGRFMGAQS
jgi:excinuclease UvrABC nuclease subunit